VKVKEVVYNEKNMSSGEMLALPHIKTRKRKTLEPVMLERHGAALTNSVQTFNALNI